LRYVPRMGLRRVALGLVAVVALAAMGFATLSFTSGDVAQASDSDWSTGHNDPRMCPSLRSPSAYAADSRGFAFTNICWSGYKVSVEGVAEDLKARDGRCAVDQIRYQIRYSNGSWSGWRYRIMATACTGSTPQKLSSWWWSRYPTANVQMRACLRDGRYGVVLGRSCSGWK
jgi:hypothetical protein